MTYPHWQGLVPSVQIHRVYSPIIPGVGVYGLTHDYGNVGATETIYFERGHHQKLTLSQNAVLTIPVPPGAMEIIFEITQSNGGDWKITWPLGTMAPDNDPDKLLTPSATNPTAVDLISAYYNGITWMLSSVMLDAKTAGA